MLCYVTDCYTFVIAAAAFAAVTATVLLHIMDYCCYELRLLLLHLLLTVASINIALCLMLQVTSANADCSNKLLC